MANRLAEEAKVYGLIGRDLKRVNQSFLSAHAFLSFQYQKKKIPVDIDRPNPFTQNALAYYKARPNRLESGVFAKQKQAEYLARLLGPNVRYAQKKFVFIPAGDQRTDPYGNMPSRRRRTALRGKIHTQRKGRNRMVFRREGRDRVYLGTFAPTTRYVRKYWRFYDHAITHFDRTWRSTYNREFNRFMKKYNKTR